MNPTLILLADDLTGAADSAAPFARRGLRTSVLLRTDTPSDADILSVDTETRAMSLPRAVQETERIVRQFASIGPLFKKIDSTLRGYIGPECAASLAAYRKVFPEAKLLVAPAFPAMGRVTRNGEQLVHGREIGAVAPLLERVGLSLAVVPRGAALPGGVDAWICDAETDEDLREIVRISRDRHPMLVGTAGLAAALAESLPHGSKQRLPHIAGPMLFVVGSASPISSAQIDALPPEVVRATPETVHLLTGSSDAVVFPLPAEGRELDAYVSRGLARDLVPILSRYDAVFLTGGATARAVLDTMKVRELRLLGEYEPGIPVCLTESGVPILTKAGAFGDERTLERIRLLRKP